MSRYIKATPSFSLIDPLTGQIASGDSGMTWARCVKLLFGDPRLQKMIDVFALIDLRSKLLALTPEDPHVQISDDEARALETVCKRSEVFAPAFLFSPGAEEFFRAFTDAPTKNPLNGAAKVEVVGSIEQRNP